MVLKRMRHTVGDRDKCDAVQTPAATLVHFHRLVNTDVILQIRIRASSATI
jgi:hypothetical protein